MQEIRKLVDELYEIQNIKDKRLAILLLYLYSEHYATELCEANNLHNHFDFYCKKCNQRTGKRNLSLPEKINLLIKNNILIADLFAPFDLLNKIRNKLVHSIYPNTEEIIRWINKFKPKTTKQVTELLESENEWVKMYISLITAIAHLHSKIPGSDNHIVAVCKNSQTNKWNFVIKE